MTCIKCGKMIEGEGIAFCPYCGAKIPAAEEIKEERDPEAEKWIEKARKVSSYPERKKILQKGLQACPGSREIRWEMLFIGEEPAKKNYQKLDFSIIKCWVLEIYRSPGDFSEAERERMRGKLFDDPQVKECLTLFPDPERKQQEYLLRLCREFIGIFLEGDSRIMGNLFGFRLERNKEKKTAAPAAEMMARMAKDEGLEPGQREQLRKTFYQAYSLQMGGKTEYLDDIIQNS